MLEKLRAGEPCDVAILTRAQIAALAAEGAVLPDTVVDLGTVPTSIAVPNAHASPDVSTPEALRAALLAADALFFPDAVKSTAGSHFRRVLERLGLSEAVAARVKTFANGASAMRALAAATGRPVGCTQATEILATPGVRLVAPLPAGCELETVYTAAVSARAADAEAARRFTAALGDGAAGGLRRDAGFRF